MADVITITRLSAFNGLKAIVEEYGDDFVYQKEYEDGEPSCVYVRDGEPSCLVGKFLAAAGVPLKLLQRADALGGTPAEALIETLRLAEIIDVEMGVSVMLGAAQARQDGGDTWGTALRSAESFA